MTTYGRRSYRETTSVGRSTRRATLVMGTLVALSMFGYVVLANRVATSGYTLAALEKEAASLEQISADLALDVAAEQSLDRLEAEVRALALTPVKTVEFATPIPAVAAR